jgi:saccharopine dehydrogenase-like NADP-dependent oxidoreductase
MLVVWPTSHALQVVIGVLGALTTGALTHQVQNAGVAPVQDTVDAVLNAVPPTLVPAVAQAVTETTTGVLATAVGTVAAVASPVGDLTGGDEH